MISQPVLQGTASPVHYRVIYDDSGLPLQTLHALTYKQCHMYFNWQVCVVCPSVLR